VAEQVALVTGASSGIGGATARLLAEGGFRVFGTSRRERRDEDGVEMLVLDVQSDASVDRCVAEVLARAGRIDVLVNNAGIEHVGVAEETTMEEARAVFETNFFGVVRMTNAVLPGMRARRQGRIVNVGSLAAWVGEPGEAFYSASKHALAGYTEALRHETWPLGIHVSLVEPGAFATNVIHAASVTPGTITDYDAVREAARRTLHESIHRGGDPRVVARLILEITRVRSPRRRYGAGREATWLPYLKVLLPQSLFDRLLRRGFGLRKARGDSPVTGTPPGPSPQ
jgi:NAD(P)-dependent dehydrogenase (short-subunit alcohol dehydrogenase family)